MAKNNQVYKYCKVQKKVLPIEECLDREEYTLSQIQIVNDEMQPTRHPLTGKHYTSKTRFREETRARGYVEVGNEYQNGFNPEVSKAKEMKQQASERFKERFQAELNK
jgi:hypothetical protein